MERRKRRPTKSVSDTCPKCGYCDKCGRSNAAPVWPYPVAIPYPVPCVPPMTWPYTIGISGTSGNISVSSNGDVTPIADQPIYGTLTVN